MEMCRARFKRWHSARPRSASAQGLRRHCAPYACTRDLRKAAPVLALQQCRYARVRSIT